MKNSNARHLQPVSVQEFLTGEAKARRKHEFVDGQIYLMSGGSYTHNLISSRVLGEFHAQLQGTPCEALGSDNKVRIKSNARIWFYYPDVTVVCGDNIRNDVFQDKPSVIVEVLSRSTRRIDEGEKWNAYQKIESLSTYIMFEQELSAAIAWQRTSTGFERTVYDNPNATIDLPEIGVALSLAAIYADVNFVREPEEEYA